MDFIVCYMHGSAYGLLRSARIVLIPTLFTNAMVAWVAVRHDFPSLGEWGSYAFIVATGLCFYLFGMWYNDRVDAEWDRVHRPDKPVPQGQVSVKALSNACILVLVLGYLFCRIQFYHSSPWFASFFIFFLPALIFLYHWMHKKRPEAVVIMGLCRGVWVMAAGVFALCAVQKGGEINLLSPKLFLLEWYAASLCVYTTIASCVARGESASAKRKKWAGILLSFMCFHDMAWLAILTRAWEMPVFALACYGISQGLKRIGQSDS